MDKMALIRKIFLHISVLLILANCMDAEKALEGELISSNDMLNKKQMVNESKKRGENIVKYGPNVVEIDGSNVREESSSMIDKENAPDYDTLQDNGKGNIFPIDINVENIEIRTFTKMLSRLTGVNFLVSDEVNGYVTAKLQDVLWPDVLDSVLNLKSLAKHVDNKANIVRIHSQENIVALENFERQRKADLQKTALLERANDPMYTEVFKLFYTKPASVDTILKSVLNITETAAAEGRNTQPQITLDERMNQLIIKARQDDMDIVKKLIAKIDARTKQVFIEAFVVEVTDDFEKALGVRLGADVSATNSNDAASESGKRFNIRTTGLAGTAADGVSAGTSDASLVNLAATGATSGLGMLFGIGDAADLKVELTALERDEVSKIISNPRIFTLDNQEATIFQGSDIPYETVSADGTQIDFKKAGLRLAVTPTVIGDGNLMMNIALNKDTADTSKSNPPITSSSITTNLITRDGSIVVIGGIYTQTKSDSDEKVPFFGDIPYAGKLFKRQVRSNDRKELLIFLAPRVI